MAAVTTEALHPLIELMATSVCHCGDVELESACSYYKFHRFNGYLHIEERDKLLYDFCKTIYFLDTMKQHHIEVKIK